MRVEDLDNPCADAGVYTKPAMLANIQKALDAIPKYKWDWMKGDTIIVQAMRLDLCGTKMCIEVSVYADTAEKAYDAVMEGIEFYLGGRPVWPASLKGLRFLSSSQ